MVLVNSTNSTPPLFNLGDNILIPENLLNIPSNPTILIEVSAPGPVISLRSDGNSNNSITVSWNAPSYSGSSPIVKYKIYNVNGGTKILVGETNNLTYIVNNLDIYKSYNLGVSAVNSQALEGPLSQITVNTACFLVGTKILCWNETTNKEEYIRVECLKNGMKVKTPLHGFLKIELIGKSILHNGTNQKYNKEGLFKLNKLSYPELFEDLYMTGAHSVLKSSLTEEEFDHVKNILGKIYITGSKYRLPLCADELSEPYNENGAFEIWHFALENPDYYSNYGVYANGLLVETCSIRYMKDIYDCELVYNC